MIALLAVSVVALIGLALSPSHRWQTTFAIVSLSALFAGLVAGQMGFG